MKVYRREHATLAACRKSRDHRDVDRVAGGAVRRDPSKPPLNPSVRPRYAIRVADARPPVMRVRNSDRPGAEREHVGARSARPMRSARARPA
jgi:hypothetical protein